MKAGDTVIIIHLVHNIRTEDNISQEKNRVQDIIFHQEEIHQGIMHLQAETIPREAIHLRSILILLRRETLPLHQEDITAAVVRVVHQEEVPAGGRSKKNEKNFI